MRREELNWRCVFRPKKLRMMWNFGPFFFIMKKGRKPDLWTPYPSHPSLSRQIVDCSTFYLHSLCHVAVSSGPGGAALPGNDLKLPSSAFSVNDFLTFCCLSYMCIMAACMPWSVSMNWQISLRQSVGIAVAGGGGSTTALVQMQQC